MGYPGNLSPKETAVKEIEAYEFELRNAQRWGYTEEAVQNVMDKIAMYRNLLESLGP